MKVVIDSNILFSALIKDSTTRKIILESKQNFLFPSYIFEEIGEHKEELLIKSEMIEEDFYELLNTILQKVTLVTAEQLIPYKEQAQNIIEKIDIDDITFIACALANPGSIIWSDDKKLKLQNKIKIMNTPEIIGYLNNESNEYFDF